VIGARGSPASRRERNPAVAYPNRHPGKVVDAR